MDFPADSPNCQSQALSSISASSTSQSPEIQSPSQPCPARDEVAKEYKGAMEKKKNLRLQNNLLQTKLAEYFRKKKADTTEQVAAGSSSGKGGAGNKTSLSTVSESIESDKAEKYNNSLKIFSNAKVNLINSRHTYLDIITEIQTNYKINKHQLDKLHEELNRKYREIGQKSVYIASGRQMNQSEIDEIIEINQRCFAIVSKLRKKNLQLQDLLKLSNLDIESAAKLPDGLHVIDFEQLKIENSTLHDKIEDRNELLHKLHKKMCKTTEILAHYREKNVALKSNQSHCVSMEKTLADEIKVKREKLAKCKHIRDKITRQNQKLKLQCGLIGKYDLLRNYEDETNAINNLKKINDNLNRQRESILENIENDLLEKQRKISILDDNFKIC